MFSLTLAHIMISCKTILVLLPCQKIRYNMGDEDFPKVYLNDIFIAQNKLQLNRAKLIIKHNSFYNK